MRVCTAAMLFVGAGLSLACAPEVESDGPPPLNSAATIAVFQPNTEHPCESRMPYPVDLVKNPFTGTLDIPYCEGDSADQIAMKTGLRTLKGWAVNSILYADFDGTVDPATVAAAVKVLDVTHGGEVAVVTMFDDVIGRLYVQPIAPLLEDTYYAAVVTQSLLDADGNPATSDQIFTFLKATEPLVDELNYSRSKALDDAQASQLEPLRQLYSQLFENVLAPAGITREETLIAWTFTTQTVESSLVSLATLIKSAAFGATHLVDVTPAATHPLLEASGLPTTNLCRIYTGQVSLRSLLNDEGTMSADFATTVQDTPVDYMLVTPKAASTTCTDMDEGDEWNFAKVAIFVHGLGRCKNDALALADTLAQVGFATLSLDGVRAGSRGVNNLGDQDLDGCPDQPATPELLALGTANPDPFAVRARMWQWGMEVMQAANVAATSPWKLIGAAAPTQLPTTQVAVVGHSWGGMAAVLGAAVSTDIDMLAVNAASADLTAMFEPLLAAGLAQKLTAEGVDITQNPGKSAYEAMLAETLAAYGWALEPADPRFAVNLLPVAHGGGPATPALVQVMTSGNLTTMPDAPLHATATQGSLVTAFGNLTLANVTFALACTEGAEVVPVCDDPTGVVGALLQPCVADETSDDFSVALAKLVAARTQLATFLASNGAVITTGAALSDCP